MNQANQYQIPQGDALEEKTNQAAQVLGLVAEFDPEEAHRGGAFVEDAISEQQALDSTIDNAN